MNLPPQPPPDVPDPPPSPAAKRSRRWFAAILILGSIAVLLCALGVFLTFRIGPNAGAANASLLASNLKQLDVALRDFADDFSSYPSPVTAADPKIFPSTPPSATSNDLFRQLFLLGHLTNLDEDIFYVQPTHAHSPPPDNVIFPPSKILEAGECGLSYVCNIAVDTNPAAPLVLAPMVHGTTTFDRKALDGRALVLFSDSSIRQFKIDRSGRVIRDGKDLFDPSQPFWHGKRPDLRHPAR